MCMYSANGLANSTNSNLSDVQANEKEANDMKKTTEEKVSQQKEKDSEKVLKQFNNLPLAKLLEYRSLYYIIYHDTMIH